MAVTNDDWVAKKSTVITDTDANGNRIGSVTIIDGASRNLFDRISALQRQNQTTTKYRKMAMRAATVTTEYAYDVMTSLLAPTNADDRKYIAAGTYVDTQSDITTLSTLPIWTGVGQLAVALSGSETSIQATFEADDFEFEPGGHLKIHDKCKASQTIASDVKPGDSVQWSVGNSQWEKITYTDDIVYPVGKYIGNSKVITFETGVSNEQVLTLAENKYTAEVLATGNGSTTNPTLSTLINNTNGIFAKGVYKPVVTCTAGGTERTVTIQPDGSCTGYCSAGQLNLATGAWTTPITFTTAPDNTTNVTITYYEKNWTVSTLTYTFELDTQIAAAYTTAITYVSGVVTYGDIIATATTPTVTSTSGTFDNATYPIVASNESAIEDFITLLFTSSTAFTATSLYSGSIGTGNTSTDFEPVNIDTGTPYFSLDYRAWGGSWTTGDQITFYVHPADATMWLKQITPQGAAAEENVVLLIETTNE